MEKMDAFFTARIEGYDAHMLTTVEGCKAGYAKMAELLPSGIKTLLDLGCGTGLELEPIFERFAELAVTGIDFTQAMLDELAKKFAGKQLTLICDNYLTHDFDKAQFDAAVSFQTMHHFTHKVKLALYKKIYEALKPSGVYIECDYMVEEQTLEEYYFAENKRIRKELRIAERELYHYDTPCTIDNQRKLLQQAGFAEVKKVFREENTTMLVANKA